MGAIGDAKRLVAEAKEKLAAADIDGANAAIAKLNDMLGGIAAIADDVQETELVKDLDAAVEEVPAELKQVAQAVRGLVDHFLRVGTRASHTAQEAQGFLSDVRAFLADLREGKVKFVTETRVEKQ